MSASQQVTGIASGMDTAGIVERLMKIEKIPYDKLDIKKQTQQLKLQAYQAVNTMFMKFRTSVGTLSSQKLWRSKSATSTNDKALTATANEYAVNGSYSFKVAQLATAAQFMTKGFSSSKTAFVKQPANEDPYKLGSITLNSSKSRVDNTAKLDDLNGGKGVYRGSVRITDGANNTSIIDLSSCDTVEDVVRTLNTSQNAQITASIVDGRLYVEDKSGGTNALRIQNVGTGTTATDLGIAGQAEQIGSTTEFEKFLHGRNVYTMGTDTSLSKLNDGLGIEEGKIWLRVSENANTYDLEVDLDECATAGDVIRRVNDAIESKVKKQENDPSTGASWQLLENLRFGFSEDKTGFALHGVQQGLSYMFADNSDPNTPTEQRPAQQLGLTGVKSVGSGQTMIEFGRVMGAMDSPMIKNLSGVNGTGLGTAGTSNRLPVPFDASTKLSALNGGKGLDYSRALQIKMTEGGKGVSNNDAMTRTFYDILDTAALNTLASDPDATVGQLTEFLNNSIKAYAEDGKNNAAGLKGLKFEIDPTGRLNISGAQGAYQIEIAGTLAAGLGLTRAESLGTAIKNDGRTQVEQDNQTIIDDFYGMSSYEDLIGGNREIKMESWTEKDENDNEVTHGPTTLFYLDGLTGEDTTDETNLPTKATVDQKLADLFGSETLKLEIGPSQYWNSTTNSWDNYNGMTLEVDLASMGFDSDTTVPEFIDAVNKAIRDGFKAQTGATEPDQFDINVPQLRLHTYGGGLQWSNMDFNRSFKAEGAVAEAMGIDKNYGTADSGSLPQVVQHPTDAIYFNANPMETGYIEELDLNSGNADTILISNLRNGGSLTFNGQPGETIDFEFAEGVKISLSMDDIKQELINNYSSIDTSVEDYVALLNSMVQSKLTQLKNDDPTVDPTLNFQITVGDNRLQVSNLTGADYLKVSGDAADINKTGIGAVNVTENLTQDISLGTLKAGKVKIEPITGLGSIWIQVGDGQEVELQTDGIDGDSTLNQLIDKLNKELAAKADSENIPELKNLRFAVNDAGTGIALTNNSGKEARIVEKNNGQSLASDLGLVDKDGDGIQVESYSHYNANSLGKKYLSRATTLESLMGPNVPVGSLAITNAKGETKVIDFTDAKTVGDIIDGINADQGFGLQCMINERGDGITFVEMYLQGQEPNPPATGDISISEYDGGILAKSLGILGTGSRENNDLGVSIFYASQREEIDVMSTDTLESLMYRISERGNYKTAIINDGSTSNPYRLTISAANTGEASDFVIESDLDMFGFNQTSRGKDAKVLFGDPNAGSSPIMLSSTTNSNSNAILGLTLELKSVSSEFVTITVDTDKDKVVEEIKSMVQTYNDLNDLVSMLDAYDEETGEPGVLFGDTSVRTLMEDISNMFYQVFNPSNLSYNEAVKQSVYEGQQTWTWMDLGVSLDAKNSASDGSGNWYSTMTLDEDALAEMVAKNWELFYEMMAGQRNASNSTLGENVKASSSFNGTLAAGFKEDNAINGDTNIATWGANNGIMADGTIADGQDEYTIYFQKPTTISRMSIYHYNTDTALKNFTVEYLDANTGKWEVLRDISNNSTDANHLGMANPTSVSAVRIKASSTNAEDGKFRLLDVQIYEDIGLAGQLNQLTTKLGDSQTGFLAERTNDTDDILKDIEDQMLRLQEKLDMKEESLWKRFTAMESALGQLQNQSNYFSTMMDSLSTKKK